MPRQTTFANTLLTWHSSIDRQLPWKTDNDPYKIWLSEIIMQQTRVAQGTPYYLKFIHAYPTITDLANAPEDDIMKLWQGLGYYSRARNLLHAAQTVRDQYNGIFPINYEEILKLKGIGKYTAAAISSFAYGLEYPVVDGNVIRVLSRYFGITEAVDSTATLKSINVLAKELITNSDPAAYNQAIMDFGALHCTPKKPKCDSCPFNAECLAYKQDLISTIPIKSKKIKKKTRHLHYLILKDETSLILKHRQEKDIWQALYDYPCIENNTKAPLTAEEINQFVTQHFNQNIKSIDWPSKTYKHILSHQTLFGQFYTILVETIEKVNPPYLTICTDQQSVYAMPVLLTNHIKDQEAPTLF